MSAILSFLIAFVVQVIALKLSLSLVGHKGANNTLTNAFGVILFINIALIVVSFVPLFGALLKPLVVLLVIMAFYKISFFKSVGTTLLHIGLQMAIKWLLALIGFSLATHHLWHIG